MRLWSEGKDDSLIVMSTDVKEGKYQCSGIGYYLFITAAHETFLLRLYLSVHL